MKKDIQGKTENRNGIFFKIPKIEIICFNTGICFLSIKTHIEESDKFADLLNFNYKFRDINQEFANMGGMTAGQLQDAADKYSKAASEVEDMEIENLDDVTSKIKMIRIEDI